MGVREIRRKIFFCDRCKVELKPQMETFDSGTAPVEVPGSEHLPNTCEMSISFPKKDRYGFAEVNSLSIRWTHLCDLCEAATFKVLNGLMKDPEA